MNKKSFTRQQSGFTLIELLVVIAIIGLLSTLAVVSLNNARSKGRDARRVSDLKAVSTALEIYRDDNNDKVVPLGANWIATIGGINNVDNIYLPAGAPIDPDGLRVIGDGELNEPEKSYAYCVDTEYKFYLLFASLENSPQGKGIASTLDDFATNYIDGQCVNAGGLIDDVNTVVTCDGEMNFCLGKL